jgi:cytochrome c oxidase subunit 2
MFDPSFWMPESVNALAQGTDSLFMFILWVSVISLVVVCGSMIFLAIRYRASSDAPRDNPPLDHLGLEVTWTLIPTIILMIVFYWGTRDYVRMAIPETDAMEIRVMGQKWFWTFDYPEQGIRLQATEELNIKNTLEGRPVGLVVPVDTSVRLVGSSADVLHSVYIPSFRMKKDVVPNRYTTTGFRATKEGVYDLFCTEYCGTKHSGMITKVTVLSKAEFASFVKEAQTAAENPIDGATVFASSGCAGCHTVTPDAPLGGIGPALYGVFGRQEKLTTGDTVLVDENYLRESIENPVAKIVAGYGPVMPSYAGRLSEEELTALIVYLKGLGNNKEIPI